MDGSGLRQLHPKQPHSPTNLGRATSAIACCGNAGCVVLSDTFTQVGPAPPQPSVQNRDAPVCVR